jgi:hypothetical protein
MTPVYSGTQPMNGIWSVGTQMGLGARLTCASPGRRRARGNSAVAAGRWRRVREVAPERRKGADMIRYVIDPLSSGYRRLLLVLCL